MGDNMRKAKNRQKMTGGFRKESGHEMYWLHFRGLFQKRLAFSNPAYYNSCTFHIVASRSFRKFERFTGASPYDSKFTLYVFSACSAAAYRRIIQFPQKSQKKARTLHEKYQQIYRWPALGRDLQGHCGYHAVTTFPIVSRGFREKVSPRHIDPAAGNRTLHLFGRTGAATFLKSDGYCPARC